MQDVRLTFPKYTKLFLMPGFIDKQCTSIILPWFWDQGTACVTRPKWRNYEQRRNLSEISWKDYWGILQWWREARGNKDVIGTPKVCKENRYICCQTHFVVVLKQQISYSPWPCLKKKKKIFFFTVRWFFEPSQPLRIVSGLMLKKKKNQFHIFKAIVTLK